MPRNSKMYIFATDYSHYSHFKQEYYEPTVVVKAAIKSFAFISLTKVRPSFTLSHRGSDNSPLLIVFNANYIDQSNRDFSTTEGISEVLTF